MLRATFLFFVILSLTGCENKQFKNPVVGQDQQIKSPLQNTVEGMAKAKSPEPERGRLSNLQPMANPRGRNPLF